jgi:hypothetical protein
MTDLMHRIQVGREGQQIRQIVHGNLTINTGGVAAGAVASASAAAAGLRTDMRIFHTTRGQQQSPYVAVTGTQCDADDTITIWMVNSTTANATASSALSLDYLALR